MMWLNKIAVSLGLVGAMAALCIADRAEAQTPPPMKRKCIVTEPTHVRVSPHARQRRTPAKVRTLARVRVSKS